MNAPDVLVVDDDPDIRAMLGFALGDEFNVRFASNGAEAIDERDLVRSWTLGAHAYLSKPTDPEQIAAKLRDHLAATADA